MVFWGLMSGVSKRRGLTSLFVVVLAWSSPASVVFRAFASTFAVWWGVNFLLLFGITLGKNLKMIYFCHFLLYLLLLLEIRLSRLAKGGLELAGLLTQPAMCWGYVHHHACLALCYHNSRSNGDPDWAGPSGSFLCS